MQYNILFRARHHPGKRSVLADALSRLQVLSFKQLAPWADRQPTPLPRDIQPTYFSLEWCHYFKGPWPATHGVPIKGHFNLYTCTFLRAFRLPSSLPLLPADIALYLSYLHCKGCSLNTVTTHMSAIAAVHKIAGVTDPTDTILIQKVPQGARRARPQCDTRLPITFPILMKLVDCLPHICDSYWDRSSYGCVYLMAFFAFLRVGEMITSSGAETNTLTLDSIHWTDGAPTMQVVFTSYKHARHPAILLPCRLKSCSPTALCRHGNNTILYVARPPSFSSVGPTVSPLPVVTLPGSSRWASRLVSSALLYTKRTTSGLGPPLMLPAGVLVMLRYGPWDAGTRTLSSVISVFRRWVLSPDTGSALGVHGSGFASRLWRTVPPFSGRIKTKMQWLITWINN